MKAKNFILFVILISTLTLTVSCEANTSYIEAVKLEEKIINQEQIQLLDVRTPEEFQEGHLENAININWNDPNFIQQTHHLDKTQPLYIYCKSGRRSAAAAQQLSEEGFEVYDLKGGIDNWKQNNHPIIK